jgi:O-antigen/teichoic acid export membrane protein
MSADTSEIVKIPSAPRPGAMWAVIDRLCALGQRFPIASQNVVAIFDQALVCGMSFFTAAIVGRLTSPEHLGMYYLVLSVVLIVSGIQEQLIAGPYMVLSKRRFAADLTEFGGSVWAQHFVLTGVSMIVLAVAVVYCATMGHTAIVPAAWALLGAVPLLVLRDGIRRFTYGNLQVKSVVALDAAIAVMQIGGLVLLGLSRDLTVLSIFGVMAGSSAVACFGWYLLNPPNIQFHAKRVLADSRETWAFGRWALFSFVVSGTTSYVMLWSLGLLFGPSSTAMLGACTTLVGMTSVVLCGVGNILTPLSARAFNSGGAHELRRILVRTGAFLSLVIGSFCLFVLATGGWLVTLVFGSQYDGSGTTLFALALNALMTGQILVVGNGLWAIDQPRAAFIGDAIGTAVTLITASFTVRTYGAFGAAVSLLCGSSATALIRTTLLVRYMADIAPDAHLAVEAVYCPEGTYQ